MTKQRLLSHKTGGAKNGIFDSAIDTLQTLVTALGAERGYNLLNNGIVSVVHDYEEGVIVYNYFKKMMISHLDILLERVEDKFVILQQVY